MKNVNKRINDEREATVMTLTFCKMLETLLKLIMTGVFQRVLRDEQSGRFFIHGGGGGGGMFMKGGGEYESVLSLKNSSNKSSCEYSSMLPHKPLDED